MSKRQSPKSVYYFCDETSMHDPIMAVGGLAVPDYNMQSITDRILEINEKLNVYYEVKWSTTRDRHHCGQTAYANLLRELIDGGDAHFHIRFAPFNEYDHKASGKGKRAATTGKMHYQLLLHRALRFYGNIGLHIRPDNGDCTKELRRFQNKLCQDARKYYSVKHDSIKSLECKDSSKEPLLQLLDVTLGALTAYRNGRHLVPEAASAKKKLAAHVHEINGTPNLDVNSPSGAKKFSIWTAKPSWGTRGSRG
jgi:hypothetical protein